MVLKEIKLYEFHELSESVQNEIVQSHIDNLGCTTTLSAVVDDRGIPRPHGAGLSALRNGFKLLSPTWTSTTGGSWSKPVEDRIKAQAEAIGIQDFDLKWSGFDSKLDGLSFTGILPKSVWLGMMISRFPEWAKRNERGLYEEEEEYFTEPTEGFKVLGVGFWDFDEKIDWGEAEIYRHTDSHYASDTINVLTPKSKVRSRKKLIRDMANRFSYRVQACLNEWKEDLCQKWYSELREAYETATNRETIIEQILQEGLLFTDSNIIYIKNIKGEQ